MTGGPPIIRSPSVFASGPELKATVKWFNPEKGFGFVELGDGSGDAFLHVSVLQRVGADAVNPGAGLRIRVGPGQKGQQVTEVLEITSQGDATPAPRGAPAGGRLWRPRRRPWWGPAASAARVRRARPWAAVVAASCRRVMRRRCAAP